MVIGITGHQKLDEGSKWSWVAKSLRDYLREQQLPLTGVSSLANGADQLFSELILRVGGKLHVILPFEGYERTFLSKRGLARYRKLCARASHIEILRNSHSDEMAFLSAGIRVVEIADVLVAVWNGRVAKGVGGTADIVRYARKIGRPIFHINPNDKSIHRFGIE
jgi:hypothetical protein